MINDNAINENVINANVININPKTNKIKNISKLKKSNRSKNNNDLNKSDKLKNSFAKIIFILALLFLPMISGCFLNKLTTVQSVQLKICNEPLVNINDECCLDRNHNDVCDLDERREDVARYYDNDIKDNTPIIVGLESCNNACKTDFCNGFDYYECYNGTDNCMHSKKKGMQIGFCGVECIADNDCKANFFCEKHRCKELKMEYCGDRICQKNENCGTCPKDCRCDGYCDKALGRCIESKNPPVFDVYCELENGGFCPATIKAKDKANYNIHIENFGSKNIECIIKENLSGKISSIQTNYKKEVREKNIANTWIRFDMPEQSLNATYDVICTNTEDGFSKSSRTLIFAIINSS